MSPTTYATDEWAARQPFVSMITNICHEEHITIQWLCDSWIARLTKNGKTHLIEGYTFPLNNAASSMIMRDKVATATLLHDQHIPVIPHYLLRFSHLPDITDLAHKALAFTQLPLVIKPNVGESGGLDVYKCTTQSELTEAIAELAARYRTLAVSPFTVIGREYRVLMLGTEPLVIYAKMRTKKDWRHNLKHGAQPIIETDQTICNELTELATRALSAVNGTIAAVDIAETPDGYKVIELNGGITLSIFSQQSPEYAARAMDAYRHIVRATLRG